VIEQAEGGLGVVEGGQHAGLAEQHGLAVAVKHSAGTLVNDEGLGEALLVSEDRGTQELGERVVVVGRAGEDHEGLDHAASEQGVADEREVRRHVEPERGLLADGGAHAALHAVGLAAQVHRLEEIRAQRARAIEADARVGVLAEHELAASALVVRHAIVGRDRDQRVGPRQGLVQAMRRDGGVDRGREGLG
jgi:hypothetical protein